jgi:hypothetical protein
MKTNDKVLVKASSYTRPGQLGTITAITSEEITPSDPGAKKFLYTRYAIQFADGTTEKLTERDLDNIISIAESLIAAEKEVANLRASFTLLKTVS